MLDRIRIVLVHTTHPGNIGATARAMKNMGLSDLCLVGPKLFPHPDAHARSSRADDLLDSATVVDTLEEAVADCQLVVGTSARDRNIPWPLVSPRELSDISCLKLRAVEDSKVAIVFGREDRGLTNEELHRCNLHVNIPSNPEFSSLNLAAAVQVICYELRVAASASDTDDPPRWGVEWDADQASAAEMERLFDHLERVLVDIDFLDPNNPRQLMTRMRRLFLRAAPDQVEINILRGILRKIGLKS